MIHKDNQEKCFMTSTATVKAETEMTLKGKCYAVYPDTVRMGWTNVNECMAIFKDRRQAVRFGSSEWKDKWRLKEVSLGKKKNAS